MTELTITLPQLDANWIESHLTELLTDGTEFFHCLDPKSVELGVGSLGYAEKYNELSDQQRERFYLSNHEYEVTREIRRHIQNILKDYGLWGKKVQSLEQIEDYNQAVRDIVFMISDRYGIAWARYMGLVTYEDQE